MADIPDDPFENSDKKFETVENYLDRLQSDLADKGYEVEWGEEIEENGKTAVEVIHDGEFLENLRVPTNLDIINKQLGPVSGYDMMLDTVESSLYYDENDGNLPFLEQ